MKSFISGRQGQFGYFDRRLGGPDWTGSRVLDFGGNVGNLLLDPACRVDQSDYWCIDVSRDAITEGRRRHPRAHFVFYDRYHYEYNPAGIPGLPVPDPGVRFDFIVAFSVVTHNNKAETIELVDQLMALLTDDGRLAFTFIDPRWTPPAGWPHDPASDTGWSNLYWMLEKLHAAKPDMDVAGLLMRAESTSLTWTTLVNGTELTIDPEDPGQRREGPGDPAVHRLWGYINMCTADYMTELFPNAEIRPPEDDRQHCAILHARKGTGRT